MPASASLSDIAGLDDFDPRGRRILLRLDLNVPLRDGAVGDLTRLTRALPTLRELLRRGGRVVIASHLGRPGGRREAALSLRALCGPLAAALGGAPVAFAEDCIGAPAEAMAAGLRDGQAGLLENLRFHPGEEANDSGFAAALARLGEIYVNDAFAAAHRAHASMAALAARLPAYAGRLMMAELTALAGALEHPQRPVAAIVGGAKVSTKLDLLGNLIRRVDRLIIGGGMANSFLLARGFGIGRSLAEPALAGTARNILAQAAASSCTILLPRDVSVAPAPGAPARIVAVDAVPEDQMILDIGPATTAGLIRELAACRTLVWNGPVGLFEVPPHDTGTMALARAVADRTAAGRMVSVAGGGDTVAALAAAGLLDRLSYVSTAGGAFLEWLEGKRLPGVTALARG